MNPLAFSSPGKALIAGGYLVLEPVYDSYVTALSSRMHAVVKSGELADLDVKLITVKSPQFTNGEWSYNDGKEVNGRYNPFLESAVDTTLKYLGVKGGYNVDITIFSDPGFHTQSATTSKKSDNNAKQFLFHEKQITDVAKTGMGSSACLTSVVITAIMTYFSPDILNDKDVLHNLSQIAHCKAQGKIGSGFDVATAIYGSIKYRRFDPLVIQEYLDTGDSELLKSVVNKKWDFVHEPCALPPRIKLLMGDIEGGSETPKLVSTVLKWKKENPQQSSQLYSNLNAANLSLIDALAQLHIAYNTSNIEYNNAIDNYKNTGQTSPQIQSLIDSIKDIRKYLKQLTTESTATIEPDSQTQLLDACTLLPGCLGGVVPGAGGYDAICLLVVDDSIPQIVSHQNHLSRVKWLDLQEQANGLVQEKTSDYIGL